MAALIRTAKDFRDACAEVRRDGRLALVPTMGFLHAGHQSLIRAANSQAPSVAVTIFVNPTQFGPNEDLARYPRDLEGDLKKCAEAGASFVFAPEDPKEIYPEGFQTYVEPGPLAGPLCGSRRPGHFRGVATVVAKLFALSRADVAFFGEKDFQQLAVIKRLAVDLDLGTQVIGRPTIREHDGLAMSSRNAYLSPEDRQRAVALSKAMAACRSAFADGEREIARLEALAASVLTESGLRVDYAELRRPGDLERPPEATGDTRVFLAAFLGKTRLIDNGPLEG
ncbi:MAG: pantoate--beta-alanine ligase [Deltaproteobacteria bacterium]|nr:pantoate--beta-alanine ligase [Deltaproteobacteria bacterium]